MNYKAKQTAVVEKKFGIRRKSIVFCVFFSSEMANISHRKTFFYSE